MTTGSYRLMDHTADFRLEILGSDEKSLFEVAAGALFNLLVDTAAPSGKYTRNIEITGADWPDLMVNWLRELLFIFNGQEQILCRVEVLAIEDSYLRAKITTEDIDFQRHEIKGEIKAVTYHQIQVTPYKNGWRALVVFDV